MIQTRITNACLIHALCRQDSPQRLEPITDDHQVHRLARDIQQGSR